MTPVQLPNNANYFQINSIDLHPEQIWLKLGMIDPVENIQYEINLNGLLFLELSKTTGDEDGIYQIGDIEVTHSTNPGTVLTRLQYGFLNPSHSECFHLRIDGGLRLDVVSTSFSLTPVNAEGSTFRPRIYPPTKP